MNNVIVVEANDDYSLDLKFSDGCVKRFDVKPYLEFGIFRELKDMNYFRRVRIAVGTVQYSLRFTVADARGLFIR